MRLDPSAFTATAVGALPLNVGQLAWANGHLYASAGEGEGYHGASELHRVVLPAK